MDVIEYKDWKKNKLKVGKIVEVERVEKTDYLYKLQIDIGEKTPIQIISSLVPYYSKKELQGRKIIVLINLKPAKFAGQVSNGMLLCAESEDKKDCTLLTIAEDIAPGSEVV